MHWHSVIHDRIRAFWQRQNQPESEAPERARRTEISVEEVARALGLSPSETAAASEQLGKFEWRRMSGELRLFAPDESLDPPCGRKVS